MKTYDDFGITIPFGKRSGQVKTLCPKCHDKRSNKNDKSLSVNLDTGVWHCHYCSWSGTIHVGERSHDAPRRQYRKPSHHGNVNLSPSLISWFNSRAISSTTLSKAKITENGQWMQFNYFLNGELINIKSRTQDKKFTLESGCELIPYNLDGIVGQKECIITEGEMDCLSFIEIGRTDCISVPNGANSNLSWLDDFIDGWFEDKDVIYIASDTDTKGIQLRDELVRRFGAERCRIVTYGEECKDANEHLIKYGKESLGNCLTNAKELKIDGVFALDDFEDELDYVYRYGLQRGFVTGHDNFDALCSFETKRLAIVTGIPSSGKSEYIDEMCVRFNINYGYKVGFFSPENVPLEYHAVKIIEKLCGKRLQDNPMNVECITQMQYQRAKNYYRNNFYHILPEEDFSIGSILAKAKYLIRRYGIRILVIDPFNRIENEQSGSETETQYISRVLDSLTKFARVHDVLIFLMAHPTKVKKDNGNGGIPTMYDINGSSNFFNKADFGIIVHRDRDDKVNQTLVRVAKVKFRHLGTNGDVYFKYNLINGRYIPWEKDKDEYIDFASDTQDMLDTKQRELTMEYNQDPFADIPDSVPF